MSISGFGRKELVIICILVFAIGIIISNNNVYADDLLVFEDYKYEICADGTIQIEEYTGTQSVLDVPEQIDGKDVKRIGLYAFSNNKNLTKVRLPETVQFVNQFAFYGCTNLVSIEIPGSLQLIDSSAFSQCKSLIVVDLAPSLQFIEKSTFSGCCSLQSFRVPYCVSRIGVGAFNDCSELTCVEIPVRVSNIEKNAFSKCTKLNDIYYAGSQEEWMQIEGIKNIPSTCTIHYNSQMPEICNHIWNSGEVTLYPTCTQDGIRTFTCTVCYETKTETIKANGHHEVIDKAVAATFTRKGKTAGSHCAKCGYVIKKQTVIPMKTGLNKVSGKTYFYKDGKKQSGWQSVGKKKYYFDKKTKVMATGKVKIGKKYYYSSPAKKTLGQMQTGKIKVGKKYYYFSPVKKTFGQMQTGWVKISKKYYYFSPKAKTLGQMVTGKLKIGKKVYKFNAKGVCLNR